MTKKRPKLSMTTPADEFSEYYWLKEELINFCREYNIPSNGSKSEISLRIYNFLKVGTIKVETTNKKTTSNFNWAKAELSVDTIITDNYKNTQNVRNFFVAHIGDKFKFNVSFMSWMKENTGKTLKDAIDQWKLIDLEIKSGKKTTISPQFEYNQYIRDFFIDNPDAILSDAIRCWKKKKSKPGKNKYEQNDLF